MSASKRSASVDLADPPQFTSTASDAATVTDDGRINVNLDSRAGKAALKRALSLLPASSEEPPSSPPPPAYTQPAQPTTPFDIKLNIVVQVVGSRGDVQPFVALGNELQKHGHRVRIATHDTFDSFVRGAGLEFYPIGGDPAELMAYMVKNPGLIPSVESLQEGDIKKKRVMVAEMLDGCWRSCIEDDPVSGMPFVADAIIANPPSFAHIHCAEALAIPLHLMFTMPWTPTTAYPHPLANLRYSGKNKKFANSVSYGVVEWLTWQGLGDVINSWRATIDLEPVPTNEGATMAQTLKIPFTYCWSPALLPKPKDWPAYIDVCGFFFRDPPSYSPPPELAAFLQNGPPPIYVGFGSIVLDDSVEMTAILEEAVRLTGVRAIISRGWSQLGGESSSNILYLGDCPHDWLFERVSCVIHHGGAGTTACGLRYGKPTTIVPFFGDQPFWGKIVAASGAGPDPIPHRSLTAQKLADAIRYCLNPSTLDAAENLAIRMVEETGVTKAVECFHRNLPREKMRCAVLPDRPATWVYKKNKGKPIYLSKMAAQVILDHMRIDKEDLKRHEINPIVLQNRRFDPISGTTSAAFETGAGLAKATTNMLWKPYQEIQRGRTSSPQPSVTRSLSTPSLSQTESEGSLPEKSSSAPPRLSSSPTRIDWMTAATAAATSAKGVGQFIGKYYKGMAVDIPLATTEGLRAIPRLYGEDVPEYVVRDWKSGAAAGGKNFVRGMRGGLTDVLTQSYQGGKDKGPLGVGKGFLKGTVGLATKVPSAALGLVAYPGQGICKSLHSTVRSRTRREIAAARYREGVFLVRVEGGSLDTGDVVDLFEVLRNSTGDF